MNNPKIRFKRDDGTTYPKWNCKSFSNTFSPLNNNTFSRDMLSENGTVYNIHYGDILIKFGEVCDIQAANIPKVNADIDTSKFDNLHDGDIILADTAEDETVGKATEIYCAGKSKVISGLHTMACRPNEKYAPKYLGYYINSPTYHNQLIPFMQGIKVTSIGRKNIANTMIYYPSDIEEQQKIADFLSTVDEVIAQSEAEVSNLQQQKKAVMQKIFSQEVRFKREDGSDYPKWNSSQISELFNISAGGDIDKANSSIEYSIEYPYAVYANALTNNGLYGYANYYKIEQDCFTVTGRGDVGCAIARHEKFVPIVRLLVCEPKHNENVDCFAEIVNNTDILVESTGVPQLTSIQLGKIRVSYPIEIKEQQKIADFLSAYDEAISYAKQELDKWRELKKGLLQQMFV